MALACALAWTCAVLLFRRAAAIPPQALNLFKNVVATGLLLVTMAAIGVGFDGARSIDGWLALAGSGVLGLAIGDTLFFAGLRRIGASVSAVTDCAYSPTVLLFSLLLLGEKPSAGLLAGGPLVVAGLTVVSWPDAASRNKVDLRGVGYSLAGVVATALGVVTAKPVLDHSHLVEATAVRLIAGSVGLVFFGALTGTLRITVGLLRPQPAWRVALPGTLVGTYVSMLLWLGGIKYTTATRAALLNQMATVFLLLASPRFGGERVPPRRWLGAGLALAGAVTVLLG
jgi:drug/metabolite transporter (DMT)-like permease